MVAEVKNSRRWADLGSTFAGVMLLFFYTVKNQHHERIKERGYQSGGF
jgi:hypothetical protein